MKNEILYVLLDNYADHEPAFLASAITCDERGMKETPKFVNKTVAPTLDAVCSCGGFRTLPDYSLDTMPEDYAALILIGGFGWLNGQEAERVVPIVRNAIGRGIIVGAICNAASFLARHGFLNNIRHTGNGLEQLKLWGGNSYTNEANYVNDRLVRQAYSYSQRHRLSGILPKNFFYCLRTTLQNAREMFLSLLIKKDL